MKKYLTPEQTAKKAAIKRLKELANQHKSVMRIILISDIGDRVLISINDFNKSFEQRKYGFDEVSLKAAEFFISTPVVSLSAKDGATFSEVTA